MTPFEFGIADGLESPWFLSMGRGWYDGDAVLPFNGPQDVDPNEEYDNGVNVGQNLVRLLGVV